MRAVVQRVTRAAVRVDGHEVGAIDRPGLLVLLAVTHTDDDAAAAQMARKIATLRILRDEQSVSDAGAPVLVVSQFTLYGRTAKGRRPSWGDAAGSERAEPMVQDVVDKLRAAGIEVATGAFGAMMAVESVNDGPFTVLVDTGAPVGLSS